MWRSHCVFSSQAIFQILTKVVPSGLGHDDIYRIVASGEESILSMAPQMRDTVLKSLASLDKAQGAGFLTV
jgi:hypothetical protein